MIVKAVLTYILVWKSVVMLNRRDYEVSSDTETLDFDELGNVTLSDESPLLYLTVLNSTFQNKPANFTSGVFNPAFSLQAFSRNPAT